MRESQHAKMMEAVYQPKQLYDQIGKHYRWFRRPDARLNSRIQKALRGARSVVNVGAGTGSYEPRAGVVLAVEPSLTMIAQRADDAAPVVQAQANDLPFTARSFDAAMAILTIHHWGNWEQGLAELQRVSRERVVILTWDPEAPGFWLVNDYFPEILEIDRAIFPRLGDLERRLGKLTVTEIPIPYDCTDGFLGAYWRRPYAYFDPAVRRAISTFNQISTLDEGLSRLRQDLESGIWFRRYGHLIRETQLDLGYRLITAG